MSCIVCKFKFDSRLTVINDKSDNRYACVFLAEVEILTACYSAGSFDEMIVKGTVCECNYIFFIAIFLRANLNIASSSCHFVHINYTVEILCKSLVVSNGNKSFAL